MFMAAINSYEDIFEQSMRRKRTHLTKKKN